MSGIVKFLTALILMLMSLENYGDSRYIAIVFLILILFLIRCPRYITRDLAFKSSIALLIILALTLFSHFSLFSYKSNLDGYSPFSFFSSFSFKIILITMLFILVKESFKSLISVLKAVLLLHVSAFFLQFFLVYSTGHYIDLLSFYTGEEQRYISGVSIPILGSIYRPTGFYNEPSTYTAYVMLMLYSLLVLRYKTGVEFSKNEIKYVLIVCASSLLTFSVAAIVYVSLFLLVFFFHKKHKFLFLFTITLLLFLAPLLFSFSQERASYLEGDSTSIRSNLIDLVNSRDWVEILFGSGPTGMPDLIAKYMNSENQSWASNGIAAPSDNGTLFLLYIKYGIVGVTLFILYIFKSLPNNKSKILLLILLLAKAKYSSFVFIFTVLTMMLTMKGTNCENKTSLNKYVN